ncbi:MAG: recombination protein RecR [Candidatus Marinimicrobia bacterium]|nr:recombination protein RecR [Candidatus Neomarinimicrobiota bacterium]
MSSIPDTIEKLIEEFSRFPGIGRKTAQRMTFNVLKSSTEEASTLAKAIIDMKSKIKFCNICHGITEENPCLICKDVKRDPSLICVIENPADIYTLEKNRIFNGLYHVLGGLLSPLDGIGPEDININTLINRLKPGYEVIIATNSSIEGETTSLYIAKLLNEKSINITRLATGIPMGTNLEYIDDATIQRAIEGRTAI